MLEMPATLPLVSAYVALPLLAVLISPAPYILVFLLGCLLPWRVGKWLEVLPYVV